MLTFVVVVVAAVVIAVAAAAAVVDQSCTRVQIWRPDPEKA